MYTLYAIPPSLYAGKARSYLIKNRVAYDEVAPTTRHFLEVVLPKAGGRNSMPTLEAPDGRVVRDGAAIVDHFEAQNGQRATPTSPRQRVLSLLLDVIGMEGLLRPAMHYRWNFPEENHALITFHFRTMAPPDADADAHAETLMNAMRGMTNAFGVTAETIEGVERRYVALLARLDRHFAAFPYVFGGRPSIADYSLVAPLYGHLGRDPKPLAIMQSEAIHVFRWVERMNRPGLAHGDDVEDGRPRFDDAFLADDVVPETLVSALRHLAIDFVPETLAAADHVNDWLGAQSDLAAGTPIARHVGMATFDVEGKPIQAIAQPYRFFLLARAQAAFDGLPSADRACVEALLDECGLLPVLDARLDRAIGRENNLEVWLDA